MAGYIPKEQLESYRRWQADSFDDPTPSPVETAPPAPTLPVAQTAGDTGDELDGELVTGIALPTAEEIEQMHAEARAAGHGEGYQAGYEAGLAEARIAAEHIVKLGDNFTEALAAIDQTVADDVLALAVELAGQVMRRTLAIDSDALLPVVREALAALPLHHGHVSLSLHPDDAAAVRKHLGDQFSHAGWQIVEDREITHGGCILRAGNSEVDATLETRWKRVLETIGAAPSEDRREAR